MKPSRTSYDTDLTDAEWEQLAPLVPAIKPGGRPPKHSRREILHGIFYVSFSEIRFARARGGMIGESEGLQEDVHAPGTLELNIVWPCTSSESKPSQNTACF